MRVLRDAALGGHLPPGAVPACLTLHIRLRLPGNFRHALFGIGKIMLCGGKLEGLALAVVAPVAAVARRAERGQFDDLVDAFLLAQQQMKKLAGNAFNIGGGPTNSISLLELLDLLAEVNGGDVSVRFEDWRAADQRYYVADTSKFSRLTGWTPRVPVHEGVRRLYEWIRTGDDQFSADPVRVANLPSVNTIAAIKF